MTDHDLPELLQRIATSPPEEREELEKLFVARLREIKPDSLNRLSFWAQNGSFLAFALYEALKLAIDRADFSAAEKQGALNDAVEFYALLHVLRKAPNGQISRKMALDLAMTALSTGMSAGVGPDALRKIKADSVSQWQKSLGKKSGEGRRSARSWLTRALELAMACRAKYPTYTRNRVARYIIEKWGPGRAPDITTLNKYLGELEKGGKLPAAVSRTPNILKTLA